jgi:hypothetical protein
MEKTMLFVKAIAGEWVKHAPVVPPVVHPNAAKPAVDGGTPAGERRAGDVADVLELEGAQVVDAGPVAGRGWLR